PVISFGGVKLSSFGLLEPQRCFCFSSSSCALVKLPCTALGRSLHLAIPKPGDQFRGRKALFVRLLEPQRCFCFSSSSCALVKLPCTALGRSLHLAIPKRQELV
ncbi:unnamed protein product, partial [Gadus morhua 'NCC']